MSEAGEAGEAGEYKGLSGLVALVARLRGPGGCPWDADQTHESLLQYLVEETHELIDAIEDGQRADVIEELGDVLYQVLFHADIAAASEQPFTIDDVADAMIAKMISRHPHVFGDREASSAEEVVAFWEQLKSAEKSERTSVLDGVPSGMPALALAQKTLTKAESVQVTVTPGATEATTEDQLGEQLMGLVAAARANGWDAERALRSAIRTLQNNVRTHEG